MKLYQLTQKKIQPMFKNQRGQVIAYKNINLALLITPWYWEEEREVGPTIWGCHGIVTRENWNNVICKKLTPTERLSWPEWYKNREMTRRIQSRFAAICVETIRHIYEKEKSNDDRPQKAIELAINYSKTGDVVDNYRNHYTMNINGYDLSKQAYMTLCVINDTMVIGYFGNWIPFVRKSIKKDHIRTINHYTLRIAKSVFEISQLNKSVGKLDFCRFADQAVNLVTKDNS